MRYSRIFFMLFLLMPILCFPAFAGEEAAQVAVIKGGVQRMEVIGGKFFFRPNHIILKVGVPVEMIIKKEKGLVPHDIVINASEAGMNFSETLTNEPRTIKFTPTKTGKYIFFCSKKLPFSKSHREQGMEGTIEVVP